MTKSDLRKLVRQYLGERLENATPASVRDLCDLVQLDNWNAEKLTRFMQTGDPCAPIEVHGDEKPISYEMAMRTFLADSLAVSSEDAFCRLWLYALEVTFSGIEEMHREEMEALFGTANGNDTDI
jgi:hypothetical protein